MVQLADLITRIGVFFSLANLALFIIPWVLRSLFDHSPYIGTAEIAVTSMSNLVCSTIALFLYRVANAPRNWPGRRIALISLLSTQFLNIIPPLICVVGALIANYSKHEKPSGITALDNSRFNRAYSLAILGFALIVAPTSPLLCQVFLLKGSMEQACALLFGLACAIFSLKLSYSLRLEGIHGAVVLASAAIGLLFIAPMLR